MAILSTGPKCMKGRYTQRGHKTVPGSSAFKEQQFRCSKLSSTDITPATISTDGVVVVLTFPYGVVVVGSQLKRKGSL